MLNTFTVYVRRESATESEDGSAWTHVLIASEENEYDAQSWRDTAPADEVSDFVCRCVKFAVKVALA